MKSWKRVFTAVLAAAMMLACLSGCGGNSGNSGGNSGGNGGSSAGAGSSSGAKTKITLRIGSGHSESNPWITALEDHFVKNVSERVSAETDYEIEWVKSYGGSVISLGNELQGIQIGRASCRERV